VSSQTEVALIILLAVWWWKAVMVTQEGQGNPPNNNLPLFNQAKLSDPDNEGVEPRAVV
jgi:hypothetical protein